MPNKNNEKSGKDNNQPKTGKGQDQNQKGKQQQGKTGQSSHNR